MSFAVSIIAFSMSFAVSIIAFVQLAAIFAILNDFSMSFAVFIIAFPVFVATFVILNAFSMSLSERVYLTKITSEISGDILKNSYMHFFIFLIRSLNLILQYFVL